MLLWHQTHVELRHDLTRKDRLGGAGNDEAGDDAGDVARRLEVVAALELFTRGLSDERVHAETLELGLLVKRKLLQHPQIVVAWRDHVVVEAVDEDAPARLAQGRK